MNVRTHAGRDPKTWLLLVLLGALGGCDEEAPGPALPDAEIEAEVSAEGVYGRMIAGEWADGLQSVRVRIGGEEDALAAYQADLRFDHEVAELVDVGVPESDFHVLNEEGAAKGIVRMAGFSVEAFEGPVELVFQFRTPRALDASDLTLGVELAGTERGDRVPPARIDVDHRLLLDRPVQ